MPDEPISRDELNKLIGNKDKTPPLTVDEVIRQANTGDLPTTVMKQRVKKKYRIGTQKEMSDVEAETVSRSFINDIKRKMNPPNGMGDIKEQDAPTMGMGDLKLAENNNQMTDALDMSLTPADQIPRVTGNTMPLYQVDNTQDKQTTDFEKQAGQIVDAPINRFKSAVNNFKEGNVVKGGLETGLGTMKGLAMPFALGDATIRQIPYIGNTTADIVASPFTAIDEYVQFAQDKNKQLRDFLGVEKPDEETQKLIDEFERTASQFIIAPFLLKGLKTGYDQLPFRQKKIMLEEIKNNLEKQQLEQKRMQEFQQATFDKTLEQSKQNFPPNPNIANTMQSLQVADELGIKQQTPQQLPPPQYKFVDTPDGKPIVEPLNPQGDLTGYIPPDPNILKFTPEQVQANNLKPPMLEPPFRGRVVVDPKGRARVEPFNEAQVNPTPMTPEEILSAKTNLKTNPEVTDVEPYVYKPKNKVYQDVAGADVQGIQVLSALEKEFNVAKQTGQPYPITNIEHPMILDRLDKTSGATMDRLHQLTNAVKEYNGLEKSTKKFKVERPVNESIETYPPQPKIQTETGQGSILNTEPIQSINPEIKPPIKGSNKVSVDNQNYVIKTKSRRDGGLGFNVDDVNGEFVAELHTRPLPNGDHVIGNIVVSDGLQRKGVATQLYNYAKSLLEQQGVKLKHSDILTESGKKFKDRIITDEMLAEADKIIRSSPDQLSANPFDYYGKMSKAYLIKGARFIEDGLIDFKRWSRKMIDEFGTDIVPHLKNLYDDAKSYFQDSKTPKDTETTSGEVKPTKEVITNDMFETAKKKYGKVDDWLYNPKEDARRQVQMVEEVFKDRANFDNTPQKGLRKAISTATEYLFDQFYNMTKKYGANGSELLYKLHDGNQTITRLYKTIYPRLARVKEILKDLTVEQVSEYNNKVKTALENRQNADSIIGNDPILKEFYENAREFYDAFRTELKDIGVATVDDYYTRIAQSKMFEKFGEDLDLLRDPDGKTWFELNSAINVDTPYVKPRTGELKDIVPNADIVMEKYFYNMSKYIAYKDAIDFYYGDFSKTMPRRIIKGNAKDAGELIRQNLDPEFLKSKTLAQIRDHIYVTALWNNPKSVLANALQRRLVDFFVSRDAYKVAKDIYKKDSALYPQKLYQILNELNFEIPDYMEMGTMESAHSKYRNTMQKYDLFSKAEQNNWQFSHVAGVFDVLSKMPEYKQLLAEGKTPLEIADGLLANNDIYTKAYRRALEIGNRTQFGAMTFNRPKAYNNPIVRLIGMFTRFKFGQWQVMRDTFRKTEGINSILSQNILRRGLTEDAYPVELLREVETARIGLENYNKRVGNADTKNFINNYVDYLKGQEKELNNIIKTLEPIKPRKEVMAKWLKYYIAISGISFSWQMLANWIQYALDDTKDKPDVTDMLLKTAYDISPLPFYGTNMQGMFKSPILPNTELFLYGNFNWKGFVKESIRYGLKVTPLGIPDRFLLNMPSRKLTQLLIGDDDVSNPRDIRELEKELRKETDKDKPDILKVQVLKKKLDQLKYNSKNSSEFKDAEKERYFKQLEKDRKLNPEKPFMPKLDTLKFEQQWKKKVLENQLQPK